MSLRKYLSPVCSIPTTTATFGPASSLPRTGHSLLTGTPYCPSLPCPFLPNDLSNKNVVKIKNKDVTRSLVLNHLRVPFPLWYLALPSQPALVPFCPSLPGTPWVRHTWLIAVFHTCHLPWMSSIYKFVIKKIKVRYVCMYNIVRLVRKMIHPTLCPVPPFPPPTFNS